MSNGVPFLSLCGILDLSTKYGILPLRKKVILTLNSKFPTSWDRMSEREPYSPDANTIIKLIATCRKSNVGEMLPVAFYFCCGLPIEEILHGSGGHSLSWDDKAACIAGRERFVEAQKQHTYVFLYHFQGSDYCPYRQKGKNPCRDWAQSFHNTFHQIPGATDRKRSLDRWSDWSFVGAKMCDPCRRPLPQLHEDGRARVWDMLPGMFGLGTWEQIENDRNDWESRETAKACE